MNDHLPFEKTLEELRSELKIAIDAADKADFEYKVARNIDSESSDSPKPLTGEEQYFLVSFLKGLVESIEEIERELK